MAAYMIFMRDKTRDPKQLELHAKTAKASLVGFPIIRRAVYGRHEVLEGPPTEGVVILEFPSFDEAKAWYDSPAYHESREHRLLGADFRCVIVEGVSP